MNQVIRHFLKTPGRRAALPLLFLAAGILWGCGGNGNGGDAGDVDAGGDGDAGDLMEAVDLPDGADGPDAPDGVDALPDPADADEPEAPGPFPAPRPDFCFEGETDLCQQALDTWEERMRDYGGRDYCSSAGESMGWVEGHILNSFVYGYLATNDTVYLDHFVEHFNGAICRDDDNPDNDCDPCLFTQETYDPDLDPEWGWYEVSDWYSVDGATRFDFMVGEGITLQAAVLFVEIVGQSSDLQALYGDDASYYRTLVEEELIPKWDRRGLFRDAGSGVGVYIFQDHPGHLRQEMTLPYNQMYEFGQVLMGMYRITREAWYRDRSAALFNHFVANTYEEDGVVNWHYWDPAGDWDYDTAGEPKHWIGEEHRCGYKNITSSSVVEAARHCIVFNADDVAQVIARHEIYDAANDCSVPPVFGYFDEGKLEEAFRDVMADPTSWGNLVETPRLIWVMDSRERDRYYYYLCG